MTSELRSEDEALEYQPNIDVDVTKDQNTEHTLEHFILHAPRGARAVYHRGPYLEAYKLGTFARMMHERGKCILVQRRVKNGRSAIFEYVMVKV